MNLFSRLFVTVISLTLLIGNSIASVSLSESTTLPSASIDVTRNDLTMTSVKISTSEIGKMEASNATGGEVIRAALDTEPSTAKPGWPELPMVSRMVLVPPTGGIHVRINHIDSYTEVGYQPFIVPQQDGLEDIELSGTPSNDFLSSSGFWPPEAIVVSEPAILRGNRLVQVTAYPMQVSAATGEVRYNTSFDFDLEYSGPGVNEVTNPLRPRPSGTVNRVIESLVVNPPQLTRDDFHRGSYLLVYYNANGIANSLAPLIEWRKRQGWVVETMAVQPNTSYNDIKRSIQTAYNEWDLPPEMIALVGDPDWGGTGIPAWPNYTDLDYARLDGNDILADADYGRISCSSIQELDRVVAKIVNYESDPFMQNTDWYRQGAVCAGNSISGLSTILVSKWVRRETLERGWDNVHEWYFSAPFQGQSVPQFFASECARGVNYVTYRGWIGMEGLDPNSIMNFQATRRYPFATTMTCQSGHFVGTFCQTEAFFRSAGGAIGSIGFATAATHVQYNNAVFTGIWHGLLKLGMYNLGTACNYGRYEMYRQYNGFEDANVANFSQWANLMGDPATEMFTDVPQIISTDNPNSISLGTTRITISVLDDNGENGIPEANVCLFKEDDDFQMVIHSDETGVAEFDIPADALTEGELLLTVTKHNTKPILETIQVEQAEQYLGAETWEIQNEDNGDGLANPGENVIFDITLKNFGSSEIQGAVTVSFASLSPWAVIDGDPIELDNAPAPGETVVVGLNVLLDESTPNESAIPIAVNVTDGETVWRSAAAIQAFSPHIIIARGFINNDRLEPGQQANIDFNLTNSGGAPIMPFTITLWSENGVVNVIDDFTQYPDLNPGQSARLNGQALRIRAHPFSIPGMKVPLKLAIESEDGFRDTTTYILTVGRPEVTDPFGPDKYGYVCFDSGDEGWEMAPTYDWVEIDPNAQNRDFNGTALNLQDNGEDADRSVVVDLPFDFQYYGVTFDRATICSNGWLAFGNQGEFVDFRNRRINSGGGPNAQLCVLWDDLQTTRNGSRVLTFYDEQDGRFIVEWNAMTSQGDGSNETFELILYDTEVVPTYSGDGVIVYQYKDVRNPGGTGASADTPYATIGINSPTDLDGLEYTYYNTYSLGARQLGNEMSIKFTTAIEYITGVLVLQVTDAWTGVPIEGAQIDVDRGFWGETGEDGTAILDDILIGDYDYLTVSRQGHNDSTWTGENRAGFTIFEAETLEVQISLLHPEFNIDVNEFLFTMLRDSTTQSGFMLSNDGNGSLRFNSRYTYVIDDNRQPERDEQWDQLLMTDVTLPTENTRIQSLAWVEDHWVLAGGHFSNAEDTLNYFYEFTRNGEYTGNRFPQTTTGLYGYKEMEYYDGLLYCAFDSDSKIVAIDPTDYHVVREWSTPRGLNNARNITFDPNTGHLWAGGQTTRLYELEITEDTVLVEVNNFRTMFPNSNREIHEYGIAWFRDDPDGFNLYLISNDENGTDPEANQDNTHQNVALFKMNPTTGEIRYLTDFGELDARSQGKCGLTITPKWNNLVWGIATVIDHPLGDMLSIFELAPNSSWISYTPHTDTLSASESIPIEMTINSADLDTGSYGVIIEFHHNAGEGVTQVPVNLHVVLFLDVAIDNDHLAPNEYSLAQNFPNPFNSLTTIEYSLKEKGEMKLELFDLQGRLIQTLISGQQNAGAHKISFNAAELSTGLYFYRMKAGEFTTTRKLILAK